MDGLRNFEYISLCAMSFAVMLGTGISNVVIPLYALEFTTSIILIGLLTSVYWIVRTLLEAPAGLLIDKFSIHKVIYLGIFIDIIAYLLAYCATNIYLLMIARVLVAAGNVLFFAAAIVHASIYSSTKTRGKALGILQASYFSANSIGATVGGYVVSYIGFRPTFLIPALFLFVFLVLTFKALSENKNFVLEEIDHIKSRKHSSKDLFRIIMNRGVIMASLGIFLGQVIDQGFTTLIPLYAKQILKKDIEEIGIMLAPRSVGVLLGIILGGFVCDKLHPQKYVMNYILSYLLGGTATFMFISTNYFVVLLLTTLIMGISFGLIYSTTPILVSKSSPPQIAGAATAVWRTCWDIGGFISPIILGSIAESAGISAPFQYASILHLSMSACMALYIISCNMLQKKRFKNITN